MGNDKNHPLVGIDKTDLFILQDMLIEYHSLDFKEKAIKDVFYIHIKYPRSIESLFTILSKLNDHSLLPQGPVGFINGKRVGKPSYEIAWEACGLPFDDMPLYISHIHDSVSLIAKWRLKIGK